VNANADLILYEEEFQLIVAEVERLCRDANAKVVFLVDKNGQLIASSGNAAGMDTTSLASLTAGNIAATGGLAKLLGEKEFSILFHEGEKDNLHISLVGDRVILVVIFDSRTSLGLVRLRVKRTSDSLGRIFEAIVKKSEREQSGAGTGAASVPTSPFAEITEDDIDNLFR
jgi:predicted regulator of Ras-like GTPase activity (Roadblock/LC7/MglB family)